MKKWFKSKTMWLGFAAAFVGLIQSTLETAPMEASTAGIVLAIVGAVGMVLRKLTTQPIGSSEL